MICESTYNADHHSWQYDINYSYLTQANDTIRIGSGSYNGRDWENDEQIVKYHEWHILKTSSYYYGDKLFISNKELNEWKEYEFTPRAIDKDSMWISQNINKKRNTFPEEVSITEINNGTIIVEYLHRIKGNHNKTETHTIIYEINKKSGVPEMKKIK